jgi:hypothetical protein
VPNADRPDLTLFLDIVLTLETKADIAHLPPAVQRYLEFTGAVGKPQVWNHRERVGGALRNGPDDEWSP